MIEFQSVDFAYQKKDRLVLKDITFKISKGEIVAIVGKNGAGKTTLLKHINGLLKPVDGDVIINGENIRKKRLSLMAQIVGLAFQNPNHQLFAETVEKELGFGPKNLGIDKEEITTLVQDIAEKFGITHLLERNPLDLSGGERRLVSIASVLTMNQQILALDEPSFGQDYRQKKRLGDFLRKLADKGMSVVLISHDIEFVFNYVDRVIVLKDGQIVADDKKEKIFKNKSLLENSDLLYPIYNELLDRLKKDFKGFPSNDSEQKLYNIIQQNFLFHNGGSDTT
ncbi:MAG: ABC transporter ATP-binding protein [Asgard group archaeon]|nr:ABC transporter ATP-binding protein [Asgard group archaeon]